MNALCETDMLSAICCASTCENQAHQAFGLLLLGHNQSCRASLVVHWYSVTPPGNSNSDRNNRSISLATTTNGRGDLQSRRNYGGSEYKQSCEIVMLHT
jgi:hypothetical protein